MLFYCISTTFLSLKSFIFVIDVDNIMFGDKT